MFCKDEASIQEVFSFAKRQATELLKSCKNGIDITVTKHENTRGLCQNRYYFLICSEIAKFLDEAGLTYGEYKTKFTGELIHEINKSNFGIKTTTKMKIKDFCDYTTQVIQYWQEKTNYFWIPSELPATYLKLKGYTEEYTRGAL